MKPLIVVTGGTRGIGAGISRHFFRLGYRVVAIYRQNREAADALRAGLDAGPGEFAAFRADLTDPGSSQELVRQILDTYGPPVVLVNNAGLIPQPAHWRQQPVAVAIETVIGNLVPALTTIWGFADAMCAAGRGRIVNISSTYARLGEAEVLAYTAAKAGYHTLTMGLARDLGPSGVTVNTLSPAVVVTDMTNEAGDDFIEESRRRTPMGRLTTAADIARAVEFFVENPMVNGVEIMVDGGLYLTGP